MKMLNEKQQLRSRISNLEDILYYQLRRENKARQKYSAKRFGTFSKLNPFSSSCELKEKWENEEEISNALEEYKEILQDKLLCHELE